MDYQGRVGQGTREPLFSVHLTNLATSTNNTNPLSIAPTIGFTSTSTVSTTNGGYWSKFGGDAANNEVGASWSDSFYYELDRIAVYNGNLYIGLGIGGDCNSCVEVWEYNPIANAWRQIGGDSINSSWGATISYDNLHGMTVYDNKLYVALGGSAAGDGEVWAYNGSTWVMVGGDAINSSWAASTYEYVQSLAVYNNKLYAGLGLTAGEAEVWEYNGSIWAQIGGDSVKSSWGAGFEYVY